LKNCKNTITFYKKIQINNYKQLTNLESIDALVVDALLEVAGVDDVNDSVDGQRRFSDVRSNDHLANAG
jgi:hypothetical protein